ncbi:pentapeptide repeat-containing protein [Paucibacter sp. O1-1]|nr:pentapeptide repeat-containing protein [Paucibacter sp. O1-1]MDA3829211.1 pentapeptide repeat-containing protein [Paucibacter sp. O1-1]
MTEPHDPPKLNESQQEIDKRSVELEKLQAEVEKIRLDIETAGRVALDSAIDREKKAAEVTKLKLESEKIQAEVRNIGRTFWFEQWKTIGTLMTALVAIIGVGLTYRAQVKASEADSLRRQNDSYLAAQKQFGEGSEAMRLSAVSSLETFVGAEKGPHSDGVIGLFVAALEAEKSTAVQSQIVAVLGRNATPRVVGALRTRNLQLREELSEVAGQLPEDFEVWERSNKDSEPVNIVAERLQRNGKAIVDVLNAIFRQKGVVEGIDLSEVTFSMPVIYPGIAAKSSGGRRAVQSYYWRPKLTLEFVDGIRFKDVNFRRAKLSWLAFSGCYFENVNMDGARLVETKFNGCTFSAATSVESFVAVLRLRLTDATCSFVSGPVFNNSTVQVKAFNPKKIAAAESLGGSWFEFRESSWKFLQGGMSVPTAPVFKPSGTGPMSGEQITSTFGVCMTNQSND